MKILYGYREPMRQVPPPTLHYGVMEGKDKFWRHVGPVHDTEDQAVAYAEKRDLSLTGFSQRITRIWRIYG